MRVDANKSRGRLLSAEFLVYYIYIASLFVVGLPRIAELGEEFNSGRTRLYGLERGWIPGRKIDLRDAQWRSFRDSVPLLMLAALAHTVLSRAVRSLCKAPPHAPQKVDLSPLVAFYVASSIGYCLMLHGAFVFFMAVFSTINFLIGKALRGSNANIAVTWVFNLVVLYCNETYGGYKFANMFGPSFAFLDRYKGEFPWHWVFNMSMLRMVSFNTDFYWAVNQRKNLAKDGSEITFQIHKERCEQCSTGGETGSCYWWREKTHSSLDEFSFGRYLAFVFYIPLAISGPIITFNAFNSYVNRPQTTYDRRGLLLYALRWAVTFLFMEVCLHYYYTWAIMLGQTATRQRIWVAMKYKPMDVAILSYLLLNALYLKFLLIWRFFRLWALVDGIEPVENMNRCMNNLYSIEGFWKSWHRSYNRWLIRYIYVPLGGAAGSSLTRVRNVIVVFVFVAMWHDMTMNLLFWGLMMSVFMAPEFLAAEVLRRNKWIEKKPWFRFVKGYLVTLTILILMVANLVGYGGGWKDQQSVLAEIFSPSSALLLFFIFTAVPAATQIMFEVREYEARQLEAHAQKTAPFTPRR